MCGCRTNNGLTRPHIRKVIIIMKDELGLYYHPQAGNALSRVYVRRGPDGEVEFRLWRADHPEVWERHPWLSMAVCAQRRAHVSARTQC